MDLLLDGLKVGPGAISSAIFETGNYRTFRLREQGSIPYNWKCGRIDVDDIGVEGIVVELKGKGTLELIQCVGAA